MKQPDADPRYSTPEGCRELAAEMELQRRSAFLLVKRHAAWVKALQARADKLDEAITLELEAKAARMYADRTAHEPYKSEGKIFDTIFGFPLGATQ